MSCVYILKSSKDGKYYIGYTADLEKRIEEHNRGKSPSVKNRGPFKLVFKEVFQDRIKAIERERQIKSYKGGEAFRNLLKIKCDPIV